MRIPKKIHFLWIPGFDQAPEYSYKNINLWGHLNPDYEIKVWNEEDVLDLIHTDRIDHYLSIESKIKRSDFARIELLLKEGGIYLDSDLEPRNSLSKFFSKSKLERPRQSRDDISKKILKYEKRKVDLSSKKLIFSREWRNPMITTGGLFSTRNRIANGVIMCEPGNALLEEFLDKHYLDDRKTVLHYLGPHVLTKFFTIKSRFIIPEDLCIIPPQHFLWEDQVGKMPRWSISKHMGKNTWGDHSKYDYWNTHG